jgi:aldose sugar dehydrogenase
MKKWLPVFLFFFSFAFCTKAQTVLINLGTTVVETSTLYTTSDPPWEMKYGPGDSLWMTTKNGKVFRIHPVTGAATLLLDYSGNVYTGGEAGMLGMTFHPDFLANPYVYIVYTYPNGGSNQERLSRFTYTGGVLTGETILIDNIAANTAHNGSRLLILSDNTLLMSTGDALNTSSPQNTGSLNGKILRINLDGSIPADNPIAGNRLYSFGHRNAQGLMLHANGKVYSTEHGPNNNDEFQIIEKGRNYGWPNVVGFCDDDIPGETAFCAANNVKEPLASWNPAPAGTWAPSDLIWYSHPSIPEFQNSFLVAFLKTQKLRSIRINAAGEPITSQTDYFVNQWGRLRDITAGPDGSIYIVTNVDPYRIIKIRATGVTPVTVSNFKATCKQQAAVLSWTTASELNNKQFLLYKSIDGIKYDLAATIPSLASAGNSNSSLAYSYTDNGNLSGTIFYKLLSEDKDGRKKDWGIITSTCRATDQHFVLLPNPANGQSKLTMTGITALMDVKVSNSIGQSVYQIRSNRTVVFPVAKWQPGIYIVTVLNKKAEIVYRNKLVVQ